MARQRQQNRLKILDAFEEMPHVIQMAQSKARNFPPDQSSNDNILLHDSLWELYKTLFRTLPDLIRILNPGTSSKATIPICRDLKTRLPNYCRA